MTRPRCHHMKPGKQQSNKAKTANRKQTQTKTNTQTQKQENWSPDVVRPNVSTKISTYHLVTLLQKLCVHTNLFSRVSASHGFHCTLSQRCAKGRRVLLELSSFESTFLIPANIGIAWQVRGWFANYKCHAWWKANSQQAIQLVLGCQPRANPGLTGYVQHQEEWELSELTAASKWMENQRPLARQGVPQSLSFPVRPEKEWLQDKIEVKHYRRSLVQVHVWQVLRGPTIASLSALVVEDDDVDPPFRQSVAQL